MRDTEMQRHLLSKSTFIRGLQCPRSLYLNRKHPDLRDATPPELQRVFDTGTEVGIRARDLFPGGIDAGPRGPRDHLESLGRTKKLIEEGAPVIYEAAFQHERVLSIMDILTRDASGWRAYEVKSSTSVTETYIMDASLQYHVITGSGLPLEDISIVHLNNAYVRRGALDASSLFTVQSVLSEARENRDLVRNEIEEMKQVLRGKSVPDVAIGEHCFSPYQCDFFGYCWNNLPEDSVFDIARLPKKKMFELYSRGIVRFKDIPPDYPLTRGQRLQVESHLSGEGYLDRDGLASFMAEIRYPLFFMDFETFMPAIPLYDESRPYQQIPFQYSLHYQAGPADEIRHFEYLAEAGNDPRREFITRLLGDTAPPGDILVYHAAFETSRLRELARDFPEFHDEIEKRIGRIRDLMVPFRKKIVYAPEMRGSYSIKAVLPALIPGTGYEGLAIADGGTAMAAFLDLQGETDRETIAHTRRALKEYCRMDTLAMVKLWHHLENLRDS
ncbi:MAG: DUF2779 domain-containing protein [Spirochaetes bacterium]|nr:DUF2779 domain-containing protein [Spirochaetota bacterium]